MENLVITYNGAGLQTALYWNGIEQNAGPVALTATQLGALPFGPIGILTLGRCLLSSATDNAPEEAVLFVTCGDWDLGTCLPLEERNKGLVVPSVYKRWANLKVEFPKAFPCQGWPDMAGMLDLAGLKLEGHHHSGLDDSRNIARVLESVWQRGHRVAAYERRTVRR